MKSSELSPEANPCKPQAIQRFATPVVAALLLAGTGTLNSNANLIGNGSFESPTGSPGLNNVRPTDWSGYAGFTGGLINGQVANYPAPQDGNQFVDISSGELIHSLTVVTPGDYVLTWFDNSLTTGWNGSYAVRVKDSSDATLAFKPYSYSYAGTIPWEARALELPALPAGTYSLTFEPGTSYTFIDNVVVDPVDPIGQAHVPDSGNSAALLGTTLAGFACLRGVRRAI